MWKVTVMALLFTAAVGAYAVGGDAKTKTIGKIEWYLDYDAAMQVAKQKNKPLWLHFGEHPG